MTFSTKNRSPEGSSEKHWENRGKGGSHPWNSSPFRGDDPFQTGETGVTNYVDPKFSLGRGQGYPNGSIQGISISDPTWTAEVQAIDIHEKILKKSKTENERGPVNRSRSRGGNAPGTGCCDRSVSNFRNRTLSNRKSSRTPRKTKRTDVPIHVRDSGGVLERIIAGLSP